MTAPDRPTAPERAEAGEPEAALADVLHHVMCSTSHHDRDFRAAPCYARYPNIVASAYPRLAADGWVLIRRDVLAQALDRMETTFNLMHPGELTDDERHGMAQHMWFGMEELRAALQEPPDAR